MANNQKINIGVGVEATLDNSPVFLSVGVLNKSIYGYGQISLNEQNIDHFIRQLGGTIYNTYESVGIKHLLRNFYCEAGMYLGTGKLVLAAKINALGIGLYKDGTDSFFIAVLRQGDLDQGTAAANVIGQISKVAGCNEIYIMYKNGSVGQAVQELGALPVKENPFKSPLDLGAVSEQAVAVYVSLDLKNSSLEFLQTVGKGLGEDAQVLLLTQISTKSGLKASIKIKNVKIGSFCIDTLEMGFTLGSSMPSLNLRGMFHLEIAGIITEFAIGCIVSPLKFWLDAELSGKNKTIPITERFEISNLGIGMGVGIDGSISLGGFGTVIIGKTLGAFGLIILEVHGSMVTVPAFGAAINRLNIPDVIEAFTGLSRQNFIAFQEVYIEPLPIDMNKMDVSVLKNLENTQKVTDAFNKAIKTSDAVFPVKKLEPNSVNIAKINEKEWLVTDKSQIRHYSIFDTGEIRLTPQFYYAAKNMEIGSYKINQGMFLAMGIYLFGIKLRAYLSVNADGLTANVMVDPIRTKWITLTKKTAHALEKDKNMESSSVLSQYLSKQEGPYLYLLMTKTDQKLYFSAQISVADVINAGVEVVIDKGLVKINAQIPFLGFFNVDLFLSLNYSSMTSAEFIFYLKIDTNNFADAVNKVADKIKAYIGKAQEKVNSAEQVLREAENKVLSMENEIKSLDGRIADYQRSIRNLSWYECWKAVGYYTCIAGLEIAKAGIYVAIGLAYTGLKIAQLALDAVNLGLGALAGVVSMIAKALTSLIYLNSATICLIASAAKAQLSASIELDLTLFGNRHVLQAAIGLDAKNILGNSENIMSGQADKELSNISKSGYRGADEGYVIGEACRICLEENGFPESLQESIEILDDGIRNLYSLRDMEAGLTELFVEESGDTDTFLKLQAMEAKQIIAEAAARMQALSDTAGEINTQEILTQITGQKEFKELEIECLNMENFREKLVTRADDISKLGTEFAEQMEETKEAAKRKMRGVKRNPMSSQEKYERIHKQATGGFTKPKRYVQKVKHSFFVDPAKEPIMDELYAMYCEEMGLEDSKTEALLSAKIKKQAKVGYEVRVPM